MRENKEESGVDVWIVLAEFWRSCCSFLFVIGEIWVILVIILLQTKVNTTISLTSKAEIPFISVRALEQQKDAGGDERAPGANIHAG